MLDVSTTFGRNQVLAGALARKDEANWPPSREFWESSFPKATCQGVAPHLFKRLLPSRFCDQLHVEEAFRGLQDEVFRRDCSARVRVYVEEQRHNSLAEKALAEPFQHNERLPAFMQRITGAHRFSLVINNFEQVSEFYSASLGDLVQSMFSVRGMPIGGCEQVVFAGNYSGTAFGIHEGFEHAFLVHLGPGVKHFYCWSRESYLALNNGSREPSFGNYEWMLSHAEHFVMEPGDVLYLPALVYHVGRQEDFSVSIAVPLYTYPVERFFSRILVPALLPHVPFDKEGMSDLREYSFTSNPLRSLIQTTAEQIITKWLHSDMPELVTYYWFRLISNGGWEVVDRFNRSPLEDSSVEGWSDVTASSIVTLVPPYNLCWQRGLKCDPTRLRVFLKGHTVVVDDKSGVAESFEQLNAGASLTLRNPDLLAAVRTLSCLGGLSIR